LKQIDTIDTVIFYYFLHIYKASIPKLEQTTATIHENKPPPPQANSNLDEKEIIENSTDDNKFITHLMCTSG